MSGKCEVLEAIHLIAEQVSFEDDPMSWKEQQHKKHIEFDVTMDS